MNTYNVSVEVHGSALAVGAASLAAYELGKGLNKDASAAKEGTVIAEGEQLSTLMRREGGGESQRSGSQGRQP